MSGGCINTLTRAASSARLRPDDTPTPSIAVPLLHMIAFTSAKSTFTRPGMVMMSLMPWTPCSSEVRVLVDTLGALNAAGDRRLGTLWHILRRLTPSTGAA